MKTLILFLFPLFSFTQVTKITIPKVVSEITNVKVYQDDSLYTLSFLDYGYMHARKLKNITFIGRQPLTDLLSTVSLMNAKNIKSEAYNVELGDEKILVAWVVGKVWLMCNDGSAFTLNAKQAAKLNNF